MNKYFKLLNESFKNLIEAEEDDSKVFDAEDGIDLEPIDLKDFGEFAKKVFEDKDWEIWKPINESGMIALSRATRWLTKHYWTRDKTDGYDEVNPESWTLRDWPRAYVIINKAKPEKKYLFQQGWGGMYSPSYARYSMATWVLKQNSAKMTKWFSDQNFQFVSKRLRIQYNTTKVSQSGVYNYPEDGEIAWDSRSQIKKITIAPGTTRINSRAFSGFSMVEEIEIPDTVTTISSYSFSMCVNLKKIKLPSNLTIIKSSAFYGCKSLKNVIIPDKVKAIENDAFGYCTGLSSIYIPKSVINLDNGIFYSWRSDVQNTLTVYCEVDEKPYSWDTEWDVIYRAYPQTNGALSLSRVNVIWGASKPHVNESLYEPNSDFNDGADLEINDTYYYSDYYSGNDNEELRSIYDDKLTHVVKKVIVKPGTKVIHTHALYSFKDIEEVIIPDSVNSIESFAFGDNIKLNKINLPESVKEIGNYAFTGAKSLKNIRLPNSLKKIMDYSFSASGIESIFIPSSVKEMGKRVFDGCDSLKEIRCESKEKPPQWSNQWNMYYVEGHSGLVPFNVVWGSRGDNQSVLEDTQNGEEEVLLDTFPDREILYQDDTWKVIKPITYDAFVELGSNTYWIQTEINKYMTPEEAEKRFYENSGVSSYYVVMNMKSANDKYLYTPKNNTNSISSSKHSMDIILFLEQYGTIGLQNWFKKKFSSLTRKINQIQDITAEVNKLNSTFIYGKTRIDNSGTEGRITKIIIEEGTDKLENGAFDGFRLVKEIIIPNSVKSIGEAAFINCKSLTSIVIPEGVSDIEEQTFWGCASLKSVKLPSTIKTIGKSAFWGCDKLTDINIPDGVTAIGNACFLGCNELSDIFVPASVTFVGSQAFELRNSYYNPKKYGEAVIRCAVLPTDRLPSGWKYDWTTPECKVIWGAKRQSNESLKELSSQIVLER